MWPIAGDCHAMGLPINYDTAAYQQNRIDFLEIYHCFDFNCITTHKWHIFSYAFDEYINLLEVRTLNFQINTRYVSHLLLLLYCRIQDNKLKFCCIGTKKLRFYKTKLPIKNLSSTKIWLVTFQLIFVLQPILNLSISNSFLRYGWYLNA